MNDRTCEHCGSPAETYIPIYTGPQGLTIDYLAGPTIDLCAAHVERFSDLYRFEPASQLTQRALDGANWWACSCGIQNHPDWEACQFCNTPRK